MHDVYDLDTSWIEKYKQPNLIREPMDVVHIYLLYINSDMSIDKIIQEEAPIELLRLGNGVSCHGVSCHGVSKEILMKIIHDGKNNMPTKKYKLKDILVFNVDLESSKIQSFSEELQFMKKIPIVDDIVFAPSLYIFHYLNGIFMFFKESDSIEPKSILKTESAVGKKNTKKVRLSDDVHYEYVFHNKTKRRSKPFPG